MSYNDIGDMFSQYSKGDPKNCQHLKELFEQAVTQMIEEGEIVNPISASKVPVSLLISGACIIIPAGSELDQIDTSIEFTSDSAKSGSIIVKIPFVIVRN